MTPARHDIASRNDIVRLVDTFYAAVRRDAMLGPIFDDVAKTDWAAHLPKMYDFWQTVLFGMAIGFRGDPLAIHLDLASRVYLGPDEFQRWLGLFHRTIDDLFDGPVADDARQRATRIASVMLHHVGNRPMSRRTPA
jgi:hemoglobin